MPKPASTPVAVSLPGGLATDEGQWLRDAELRPLTGLEEDWLIRNKNAPNAVTVTNLLSSCLVTLGGRPVTAAMVEQLLIGDRDFLMLALRGLTLGEDFFAVVNCSACREKMDVNFKAGEVPVDRPPSTSGTYTLQVSDAGRERDLRFRLPTGADQEAVVGLPSEGAGEALLLRCLLDDGGISVSGAEKMLIAEAIERHSPKLELELELRCPSCGHQFVVAFDTTAFFLQELRGNDRNLLQEFHSLAFHYHWSHSEILGLDRERRRTYLSLLTDELRRN
jgi:hypothetical protein